MAARIKPWDTDDYPLLYHWIDLDGWDTIEDSVIRDIDGFIQQQRFYDSQPSVITWAAYQDEYVSGHLRFVADLTRPWIGEAHCYFAQRVRDTPFTFDAARQVANLLFDGDAIQKIQMCAMAEGGEEVAGFIGKLGGTLEGRIRMMYSRGGQLVDGLIYGLTKEQFYESSLISNGASGVGRNSAAGQDTSATDH